MRLKKIQHFFQDEDGTILVFTAVVLPIILLLGVIILESGRAYILKSDIVFLSNQLGRSVLIEFDQVLKDQATTNYSVTCIPDHLGIVPSICSSVNIFDFLSDSEIYSLAHSSSLEIRIDKNIQNFLVHTDGKVKFSDISVIFPDNFYIGDHDITAKIEIKKELKIISGNFLGNKEIIGKGLGKMKLQ